MGELPQDTTSSHIKSTEFREGVILLLDILGWKGIYKSRDNAIQSLKTVVEVVEKEASSKYNIKIGILSDTIIAYKFFDGEDKSKVLDQFHDVGQELLQNALTNNFPARGAVSQGEFFVRDQIFVGPAIDEVAEWYEQAEWIGIHMTPSADFVYNKNKSSKDKDVKDANSGSKWVNYDVKTRSGVFNLPSLKWGIEDVYSKFLNSIPITPDIAKKLYNTLEYYNKINK